MLSLTNICRSFGDLQVLKGISLEVKKGEIVSIVGASGAGKSTLLHIIGTLDRPDKGDILINQTDIRKLSDKKLSAFRNKEIGFVFQFHHLLPEFTAAENIAIPAMIAGKPKKVALESAMQLLSTLNLADRSHHKPSQLSGGEQQRVAVARALVNNPGIVLADEPSGNLDSASAIELHALFFSLRDQLNQTFIIVTHNPELADMADRKIRIRDGIIDTTS